MTTLLTVVVVVLAVIALAQIVRVTELGALIKGTNQYEMTDRENQQHGWAIFGFMFLYFGFFIWLIVAYGDELLPISASEHGNAIDTLMNVNLAVITLVFFITHVLLFYFSLKYAGKKSRKADFITHNNKLEAIWTFIPATFLAVVIIYGISTWDQITMSKPENTLNIELYAKQFDWTARYGGEDNELGKAHYLLTSVENPLGVISPVTLEKSLAEWDQTIADLEAAREEVYPGGKSDQELVDKIRVKKKQRGIVEGFMERAGSGEFAAADDDIIKKVEIHIPVNRPVNFEVRSRDVIHSAYLPHFRHQINAVPGMVTNMYFTPILTTAEMREETGNPDFNYLLYCNKICGSAHYNMQMVIVVDTPEDYEKWINEQETLLTALSK